MMYFISAHIGIGNVSINRSYFQNFIETPTYEELKIVIQQRIIQDHDGYSPALSDIVLQNFMKISDQDYIDLKCTYKFTCTTSKELLSLYKEKKKLYKNDAVNTVEPLLHFKNCSFFKIVTNLKIGTNVTKYVYYS